jgi:heme/copper-type cytochrome/quinol oxidase subunit 3
MSVMLEPKKDHRIPPGTSTVGMYLFLAALTMLFGATMIGYAYIRLNGSRSPGLHVLHLPKSLWLSTAHNLPGSWTLHEAVVNVRRERLAKMRKYVIASALLAVGFVIVQVPSLAILLKRHHQAHPTGLVLYGLVFVLILVHALHVAGGIIGLSVTVRHAMQNRYDHENYTGIKHAAMYWHFLDAVWLVMFLGMFFLG